MGDIDWKLTLMVSNKCWIARGMIPNSSSVLEATSRPPIVCVFPEPWKKADYSHSTYENIDEIQ